MVKTKIICTIGPSSSSETVLRKMMLAGMDVARLNFSHAMTEEMTARIKSIRALNMRYRRRIKILGDLQGHRVRVGRIEAPIELKKGQRVCLSQEDGGTELPAIPFDYRGSLRGVKQGHYIYIDDGNIALVVTGRGRNCLKARVTAGGLLKSHKGINIPEARLEFNKINTKDLNDIIFCKMNDIDYVAQSFVCSKKDVLTVRAALGIGHKCMVISKIENKQAIRNIDEIIGVSDGIMIARGDMGVSLPVYKVPMIQKMIIKKCNRAKKPVITATQMLESMTQNPRPTRAEVADVANAIIDGTDFVMLSAETALGRYPSESVRMMNDIIKFTENPKI
ncbi:MAG: pyruvate kinase [Candidatus Omnitrophica bacterium]|nr:pyruvate kinase [Candidatus Omnitrophota bacterium]